MSLKCYAVRLLLLGLDSSLARAVLSVENVLSFDARALKKSDQESRFRGELNVPVSDL